MISVLVADDSAIIRRRISLILDSSRRISVVGTARNGLEAVEKAHSLKPDVITMDVEMPVMNGLEALDRIMKECSVPVIMLSALTGAGADVTLKALELGAVDFIPKPSVTGDKDINEFTRDLILKIRAAVFAGVKKIETPKRSDKKSSPKTTYSRSNLTFLKNSSRLAVAIGISTGGPKTLLEIIPRIPADFPGAIFIAQHMPAGFTATLAERLDSVCRISVKEAVDGDSVSPGVCYLAPGGRHMRVMHKTLSRGVMIKISDEPASSLYKPSIDELMYSVADIYGDGAIGVIMTGMGRDGTKGVKKVKARGGVIISEDKSTCIVYGMPKSVEQAGYSNYVAPSFEIPELLLDLANNDGGYKNVV